MLDAAGVAGGAARRRARRARQAGQDRREGVAKELATRGVSETGAGALLEFCLGARQ